MDYHIVRMDETLDEIAETYNITKEDIVDENTEIDPEFLFTGQVLIIPLE